MDGDNMKKGKARGIDRWSLLLPLLLLFSATNAEAASFDCAKARTAVEKMICADAELSKLDDEMAAVHRQASEY